MNGNNIIEFKLYKWVKCKWLFGGFIGIIPFLIAGVSIATFKEAVLFIVFQILGILLPGMWLVVALRIKISTKLALIAYGYGFGYGLTIATYYILTPVGLVSYVKYMLIVEGLLSFYYLFFRNKCKIQQLEEDKKGNIICIVAILIMFIIRFVIYYGVNIVPFGESGTFYTSDLLYYIGNGVELSKGYPPMDFRLYTQEYRYHFFGSLQLAVLKMFLNSSTAVAEFCFAYIQSIFLLVFGAYMFLKQLQTKYFYRIWGMVSLLFVMGFENYTLNTYSYHLYVVPFGFEIGLAYVLFTMSMVLLQMREKKFSWLILVGTLLMFAVSVGSKAPIATVLLAVLGMVCAYYLFIKKQFKTSILYGAGFLTVYLIIYFGVVSMGLSTLNTPRGLSLGWFDIIMDSGFGSIYQKLITMGIPTLLACILLVIPYLIACNPVVFGVFLLTVVIWTLTIKKTQPMDIFCLTGVIVGCVFAFSTNQEGKSQIYFLMGAIPFAVGFAILNLNKLEWKPNMLFYKKTGAILLTLLTVLGFFGMIYGYKGYFKLGVSNLLSIPSVVYDVGQTNLLTQKEHEAYEWIRENTQEDSLFVSNIMLQEHQDRSFVTGVFTERHLWLEGWGYGYITRSKAEIVKRVNTIFRTFSGDIKAIEELKKDGVDYLIQIKRIEPNLKTQLVGTIKVYENEEVIIHELKDVK